MAILGMTHYISCGNQIQKAATSGKIGKHNNNHNIAYILATYKND